MLSEYLTLRLLGSFSLDEPGAAGALIGNLDRRKVRLSLTDACCHFGYQFPRLTEEARVQAFLLALCDKGDLVQVEPDLYCRPDMTQGRANLTDALAKLEKIFVKHQEAIKRKDAKLRKPDRRRFPSARRGKPPGGEVAGQVEAMKAFARGRGGRVTRKELEEEGRRLGYAGNRIPYLIQILRATGFLRTVKGGLYEPTPEPAPAQDG